MKKISLKMTIIASIIVFILTMGATYAYLSYSVTNDIAIKGNIVNINATLNVELVSEANTDMVPMMDNALNNAINGTGGTKACVDSKGNLSCQVYKITLTNQGSTLKNLKGTIELYATNGGVYNNLKWQELSTAKSIKDGSSPNGMAKSTLVSGLTVKTKETKTWYIGVWISEIDADQRNTDKGKFGGTVTFGISEDFISTNLKKNAVLDTNIDFSNISSDTNGKGVYIRSGTENDTYPIYYYRGAVDNNVIFSNFCWKIVRTTETGGVKLIYNGVPSNGTCNNTGDNTSIGTSAFNTSYNSPAYVGYMYGTVYSYSTKSMSSVTDTYYYGNDVKYQNGTYTLTNAITSNSWSSIYNTSDGIYNHHYTCLSTSNTCSNIYYIYYTSDSTAYYITLTDGKKVENALSEMLDYNTNNSTIKNVIDNWYSNNMTDYTNKLEDAIWCNDRSIETLNGWDPNGGNSTNNDLHFSAYNRARTIYSPSLICSRDIDKFTTSSSNGNGSLTYPVGLLTVDEIMLAGGGFGVANDSYYLYTGNGMWFGSPHISDYIGAGEFVGGADGGIGYTGVNNTAWEIGVRPSVSLAPGTEMSSGDGTANSPYIVD